MVDGNHVYGCVYLHRGKRAQCGRTPLSTDPTGSSCSPECPEFFGANDEVRVLSPPREHEFQLSAAEVQGNQHSAAG